jgi:hypothetical protein
VLLFEEGYEVFSFLGEPIIFGGQELVFFDVVNFQQICFDAVSQVSVDFFGIKMKITMIKLVNVLWSFLEHVKKLDCLKQITEF